jgi:CheY-like chemotaxis protein
MQTAPTQSVCDVDPLFAALERELQGPVNGVLAMVELLSRQTLPPDAATCVRTLEADAQRLQRILASARELADTERGSAAARRETFAVRSVIDRLQARWGEAGLSGQTLLASYEGDGELSACGDPDRLAQIFDGIVDRAKSRSRSTVEASLTARLDNACVRLTGRVRDDGPDLAPQGATEPLDADGGLGLALAGALLRQMGGQISVSRNVGPGSTVTFEIEMPRSAAEPAADQALEAEGAGLHILIVDDNATNRLVAEAFCDMFGCTSDSAEDGVEALEAMSVRRYDVVLMDIRMPRMDGVEATCAIRALPGPERDTPVFALTANADTDDVRRYIEVGMLGVIEKPIKADRLSAALNSLSETKTPASSLGDATKAA